MNSINAFLADKEPNIRYGSVEVVNYRCNEQVLYYCFFLSLFPLSLCFSAFQNRISTFSIETKYSFYSV